MSTPDPYYDWSIYRQVCTYSRSNSSVSFGQAGFRFRFFWETTGRDCKVLLCLKTLLQNLMEFRYQLPTEVLGVSKCTGELGIPAAALGKLQELQLLKECYITGDHGDFLGHLEAELQHLQVFLFEAFMLQLGKSCMSCHALPLKARRFLQAWGALLAKRTDLQTEGMNKLSVSF